MPIFIPGLIRHTCNSSTVIAKFLRPPSHPPSNVAIVLCLCTVRTNPVYQHCFRERAGGILCIVDEITPAFLAGRINCSFRQSDHSFLLKDNVFVRYQIRPCFSCKIVKVIKPQGKIGDFVFFKFIYTSKIISTI